MKGAIVLACVIVLVFLCCVVEAYTKTNRKSLGLSSIFLVRGGKSKKTATKTSRTSKSSRKSRQDDNDEDEDEEEEYNSRKKKGRKTPIKKGSKKGQLIPWGTVSSTSISSFSNLKAKFDDIAKKGQSAYKDVYRRAKVMGSSAFEGMLLKATWPGNEPVPNDILSEITKHSIPAFKYSQGGMDDDPYHMTLHKVWTKLIEKDWRTVTKSLFLLHSISRESEPEACEEFAQAIKEMSKARNPKKTDHKYFDPKMVEMLDKAGAPFKSFVQTYSAYVMYRMKNFSSKFAELSDLESNISEKEVVSLLQKAQKLLENGLKINISKGQVNSITGQTMRLVVNDIKDLWKHFSALLKPFVKNESSYNGEKADKNDITSLLQFHSKTSSQIQDFCSKVSKSFASTKVKIPATVESILSVKDVDEKLKSLTSISGGYTPRNDDDDDDEDEDVGDEDFDDDQQEAPGKDATEEEDDDEDDEEDEDREDKEESSNSTKDDDDEDEEDEGDDEDNDTMNSSLSSPDVYDDDNDDEDDDDDDDDDRFEDKKYSSSRDDDDIDDDDDVDEDDIEENNVTDDSDDFDDPEDDDDN